MLINSLTKRHLSIEDASKRARFNIAINKNNELDNNENKRFAIIVLIVIAKIQ